MVALAVDPAQLAAAADAPLTLKSTTHPTRAFISEAGDGVHVRADQFVFRLDPGEDATTSVYATRFGNRADGVAIDVALDLDAVAPAPTWPPTSVPAERADVRGIDHHGRRRKRAAEAHRHRSGRAARLHRRPDLCRAAGPGRRAGGRRGQPVGLHLGARVQRLDAR